jgi:hypothetical protein
MTTTAYSLGCTCGSGGGSSGSSSSRGTASHYTMQRHKQLYQAISSEPVNVICSSTHGKRNSAVPSSCVCQAVHLMTSSNSLVYSMLLCVGLLTPVTCFYVSGSAGELRTQQKEVSQYSYGAGRPLKFSHCPCRCLLLAVTPGGAGEPHTQQEEVRHHSHGA